MMEEERMDDTSEQSKQRTARPGQPQPPTPEKETGEFTIQDNQAQPDRAEASPEKNASPRAVTPRAATHERGQADAAPVGDPAVNGEALPPELASLVEDMETYDLVAEAEALQKEIARQEDVVIPVLEQRAAHVRQMDAEIDELFRAAYEDPLLARVQFDQVAVLQGPEEAARQLRRNPAGYGTLNGGLFQTRKNREVREALAALVHRGTAYHRALAATAPLPLDPERGIGDADALNRDQSSSAEAAVREYTAGDPLDRRLEHLYEDPVVARKNFDAIEERLGTDQAALGLAQSPEGLGPLRPDVSRSAALRFEYARGAAMAASHPLRRERRGTASGSRPEAALDAARERIRVLRNQMADLNRRIEARTKSSRSLRGRSRGQMKESLEERLGRLSSRDQGRVLEAFTRGLASQGRTPTPERGRSGRSTRIKAPWTMKRGTAGVGAAARRVGTGSAAASIALHLAERAVRRGVEEITGRETFSR